MSDAVDLPERLRAERERRGLSVQQAADDLRLDPRVIAALESGEFANVGAPVYAKGHLKKYAALLGIPSADVTAMIGQLDVPVPEQVNADMATRIAAGARFGGRSSKRPAVGVALLAVLIAGVLWWKPWRWGAGERAIPAAFPVAADANPARPAAERSPAASGTSAPGPAAEPPAPLATATPPTTAPAANAAVALQFTFTADCWVDVRDARGTLLFQGIAPAGSSRRFNGRAPFTVTLGHAAGVTLRIGDRPVAIAPSFVSGNIARFVVGADGALSAVPAGSAQPSPP